jgi:hypothetical protein
MSPPAPRARSRASLVPTPTSTTAHDRIASINHEFKLNDAAIENAGGVTVVVARYSDLTIAIRVGS